MAPLPFLLHEDSRENQMRLNARVVGGVVVAASLLISARSEASMLTFNDLASWQAAVGGGTGLETFNGFSGADKNFKTPASVSLNMMMVTGTTGSLGALTQVIDISP